VLIHSEASLSVRLLRNSKLLSSTTMTQNKLSVGYFNTCNTHLIHSAEHISPWSTLHCQFTVFHADSVIAYFFPSNPLYLCIPSRAFPSVFHWKSFMKCSAICLPNDRWLFQYATCSPSTQLIPTVKKLKPKYSVWLE